MEKWDEETLRMLGALTGKPCANFARGGMRERHLDPAIPYNNIQSDENAANF